MDQSIEQIDGLLSNFCNDYGLVYLGLVDLTVSRKVMKDFDNWLDEGRAASMEFLRRYREIRADPKQLLDGAHSAILFALPYDFGQRLSSSKLSMVAQYAHYKDYHKLLKRLGQKLAHHLHSSLNLDFDWRLTTDSAPVLERALAAKSRKGFIGKNTCYIHPEFGSFLLLAELLVTLPLRPDNPVKINPKLRSPDGGCGTCRRCQVFCPTGALDHDYRLDARLCLAYWTIEHRGLVPIEFWAYFKDYWFGCDICQNVCPYNRSEKKALGRKEYRKFEVENCDLLDVALMDAHYYEKKFGGTPMTRAKKHGLQRNAIIAMAARQDERLDSIMALLSNNENDIVRGTVKQVNEYRVKFGAGGGT